LLFELRELLRFLVEAIDVLTYDRVRHAAGAVELRFERQDRLLLVLQNDEPAELGVRVPAIDILGLQRFVDSIQRSL
jgi:hypothetical protein